MTDKDIIKALECCDNERDCTQCPMKESYPFCDDIGPGIVLDLIKRQQAEIKWLKGWQDLLKAEKHSLIKAEAIKEFAERLKNIYVVHDGLYSIIDNLVKEITEQRKEGEKND